MGDKCEREREIATLQSENKTLFRRVGSLEKDIKELHHVYDLIYGMTTNISLLTDQMARTNEDVKAIKQDVEEIKMRPAKDYIHYKRLAIGLIITTILGAFLAGKFM
jgi:predicted  nucleic acid-binding Zn-ribbon protein